MSIKLGYEEWENDGSKIYYFYRHTDGEHYSCIADSLNQARNKRDIWLNNKLKVRRFHLQKSADNFADQYRKYE